MTVQKKRKHLLRIITAVVLVAALSIGIWFGTRGSGEPVNVYSFQYIGMTEFWGDMQESYGPVVTDKIQTEFLSDTQTVTEVKVKDGDSVKKGDVLFTFDTSLDALSLERKRLEVEKIKVQIDAAGERLQETREMVPYEPPKVTEPEEPDPDEELTEPYKIFPLEEDDEKVYTGKSKETALICWLKDGTPITDDLLQKLYDASKAYQAEVPQEPESGDEKVDSSASNVPEQEIQNSALLTELEETFTINISFWCNDKKDDSATLIMGKSGYTIKDKYFPSPTGYTIRNAYDLGETYWLESAVQKIDANETRELESLTIPPYPQDEEGQKAWIEKWGKDVEVRYIRAVSLSGSVEKEGVLETIGENQEITLTLGEKVALLFTSEIDDPPANTTCAFEVVSADDFLKTLYQENALILTGTPLKVTEVPISCMVRVKYTFTDNTKGKEWNIIKELPFKVSVQKEERIKTGEFYVVFKTTDKNYLKGVKTLWQGAKVTAYENGTFDMLLYDPYNVTDFKDHTIPEEDKIEIDLPVIDPNAMYTAEQILEMQKQCYATIKEQNEKLKMAESEYEIMQRELGDGNVYAEIDGKVVSLLTEDEAREQKLPLIKVSGGGGFYIEGSVSELEKEKLKLGQEVTINDWNSGGTYTGEVIAIGDFPSDNDNWNGMGNPTASYYPFKAFVGEEADLQSGSYVSMSYSTASAERGIYLEKAFVRTEKDGSYIYVRGADGKLEKRNVQVGKVLWGSYYEILSSLGEEDFLAFPYGKNVKQGAPTVESDLSTLYTY